METNCGTSVEGCERCPRLRSWCSEVAVAKAKRFADQEYWALPVPDFGDPEAVGLIVGLAPAAHGANRTGRMFTGDRSGDWLYRALHANGLANQPHSTGRDDGLRLSSVLVTAVCHCAPPDNKPTHEEIAQCSEYLHNVLGSRPWRAVLCLGGTAWRQTAKHVGRLPTFGHGAESSIGPTKFLASYHPSQQNTFTGRLTETMLLDVCAKFRDALQLTK